jgi:hypothetical protein
MLSMASGIVVLVATAVMFWLFLPRGGKRHRFVETELEPYIGVAFTAAVALGLTMLLSGVIDFFGAS